MKKATVVIFLFLSFVLFINSDSIRFSGEKNAVNWISFEEAVEKTRKDPKPILIDIYTQWCGPCKLMSKNTFGNKKIAEYLNTSFYCVKFDAESFDTVRFKAIIQDTVQKKENATAVYTQEKMITFVNTGAPGTLRSPHQFALSILDGKLSYPSLVFLSPEILRLDIRLGYHVPEQFEPIIHYYGSGSYKSKKFEDFEKTFKSEL